MKDRNLDISETAKLFGISPVTIQRWMHQGKIPFRLMGDKPFFKYREIRQWAKAHDLSLHEFGEIKPDADKSENLLAAAIKRGGIYRGIEGNDVWSAFEHALKALRFINTEQRKKVHDQLLSREEMASTGIGGGIALPHSRERMKLGLHESHISIIFLNSPIDFNAVDGEAVNIFFMMFTPDTRSHLNMLSRISQLMLNEEFRKILQDAEVEDEALLKTVADFEGHT